MNPDKRPTPPISNRRPQPPRRLRPTPWTGKSADTNNPQQHTAPESMEEVLILRAGARLMSVGSLTDQVYSFVAEDGRQFHWSVVAARRLAEVRGDLEVISLADMGITVDFVRSQYQGLDEAYALTTDLTQPLLFVPFEGKVRLIDGWHRLFRAATEGVDILPAYFLTQEEADASLVCCLPPGEGIDLE